MNPALPLLAAIPLAAGCYLFYLRRIHSPESERGERAKVLIWIALGTLLLFAPILGRPDAVPSGTALLDRLVPWNTAGEPSADSVHLEQNDLPYQVETRLLFLRDEVRAGRPGFWNPYAFGGYPQWSAIQVAPLSPFTWIYLLLPLDLGLHVLPFLRFLVAGLGAWLLARELGTRAPGALLAALTFAFSGRLVSFVLYPLGTSIALMPWVLLAVERTGRGAPALLLLAVTTALQWTSGHPETAAFTVVAAGLWFALRGDFAPRAWGRLIAGFGTGILVSAATVLPFLLVLPGALRYNDYLAERPLALTDQASVLLRFLLPEAFGDPSAGTGFGRFPYVPTLIYSGALLVPLAVLGLAAWRREASIRRLALFGGATLALSLSLPGLYDLFLVLPVIKRGIAHYFLSFAILAAALLAGVGLDRLANASRRLLLGSFAMLALALGGGILALAGDWRTHGLLGQNLGRAALIAATPLLLLALRSRIERPGWRAALLVFAAAELVLTHLGEIPRSRHADLYPERPALTLLAGRYDGRLLAPRWVLPANTGTPYRIHDVRGADSVTPALGARALGRWSGEESGAAATAEESARFDGWSIRYWMMPPGVAAPEATARLLHDGADARVFERPSALPIVRFESPAPNDRATVVERTPGRWVIDWSADSERVLSVADAFDRGWSALDGGRERIVDGTDPLRLRIAVGPGSGRLTVDYLPYGFAAGAGASAVGLLLLVLLARFDRRDRAQRPDPAPLAAP